MYNPQLQSQGGMAVAPPSPSATSAVSNVLSGALDVATDVMQGQAEQKAAEQTALDDMMVADTAANLAGVYSDMSGQPTKMRDFLRNEVRRLRQQLSPTQFTAVAAQFKKLTNTELYTTAGQTAKEQNELQQQQRELLDRQMQNIEYAVQYREGDAELQKMLTPEGNIADGYTAEDVANRGDLVRSQQQARLAIAQQKASTAKSAAEKAKAEGEIFYLEKGPILQRELNEFVESLAGEPVEQGLNKLSEFYNDALRGVNLLDITEEAKKSLRNDLKATYDSYVLTLSEEDKVLTAEKLAALSRRNSILKAAENNDALNVVMSLNDAGVRPSDSTLALAESGYIDFYEAIGTSNPNDPKPNGVEDLKTEDGKTVKWDRVMRERYKRDISIKRAIQSEDEIKTYRDIFATVLNPVTGEQRNKFFGPNGGYLSTLSVFQDAEIVERYTPAVLNAEEVREGFINANNTAITRYVPATMTMEVEGQTIASRLSAPSLDSGYPQFSYVDNANAYQRARRMGPYQDIQFNQMKTQIDNMNRLFRMQYEAAYNYGMTVGGKQEAERMAKDTVASQMRAILQYMPADEDVISRLTE